MQDLKFTDTQRNHYLNKIEILRKYHVMAANIPDFVIQPLIDDFKRGFIGFMPFLKFNTCFTGEFHRIVINKYITEDKSNSRLTEYSQISYPPIKVLDKISFNRANLPGQSVFYAGSGNFVATLETKFQKGDLFTHSKWRQKEGTSIVYLPIYHSDKIITRSDEFTDDWIGYKEFLKSLDKNVAVVVNEMYNFIATIFSCKINPDNKREYLICALMADLLLNDPKNGVDCLFYPSVASDLSSTCIALKPAVMDAKFNLVELSEDFCLRSPDEFAKGWMSYRTAKGTNLNRLQTKITWEDQPLNMTELNIKEMMNRYNARI